MKRFLIPILALALLLTGGCASAGKIEETASDPTAEPVAAEEDVLRVSTLDELFAAVAPGAVIELGEGVFTLTPPENAGEINPYCRWVDIYDGYELEIHDVDNLTVRGSGADKTTVSALPRYANVLTFRNCRGLTVEDLRAGHTEEPGACSGGVLYLYGCRGAAVRSCALYGCGTVGVQGEECADLTVQSTRIYECSYGAVSAWNCGVVHIYDCDIDSCGAKEIGPAFGLFEVNGTDIFAAADCRITDNAAMSLVIANDGSNIKFLSNDVSGCRFDAPVFDLNRSAAAVDGCSLVSNSYLQWSGTIRPVDAEGAVLSDEALAAMTLRPIDPQSVSVHPPLTEAAEVEPGGELRVSTVDEFLSAIGPDRTVILAPGVYDLSAAAGYGGFGGKHFYWQDTYDGPELVIDGVSGLMIRAESDDPRDTVITAAPRYANVLSFRGCSGVGLTGFTAGHSEGIGECTGGVISLQNSSYAVIDSCRLYGCGTSGVNAWQCSSVTVTGTEIFECSWCAAYLYECDTVAFRGCNIHDVPSPALTFDSCAGVQWNGATAANGQYNVSGDVLKSWTWGEEEGGYTAGTPFRADSPELAFALKVQGIFALGDWAELAKTVNYPLRIYTASGTYVFDGPEGMRAELLDELLDSDFRRLLACSPLDEYIPTAYGSVFAGGRAAFEHFSTADGTELRLTAISATGSLY